MEKNSNFVQNYFLNGLIAVVYGQTFSFQDKIWQPCLVGGGACCHSSLNVGSQKRNTHFLDAAVYGCGHRTDDTHHVYNNG